MEGLAQKALASERAGDPSPRGFGAGARRTSRQVAASCSDALEACLPWQTLGTSDSTRETRHGREDTDRAKEAD